MLHPVVRACAVVAIGVVGVVTGGCSKDPSTSVQPSSSMSPSIMGQVPSPSTSASPQQSSATLPGQSPSSNPSQPAITLSTQDQELVSKNVQVISKKESIAKQDTGKTYLSGLLQSQQAEHLVQGRFTNDLKRLSSDIPTNTEDYKLEIRQADTAKAFMVAVAKQPGFSSYSGVVYAIKGKISVTGICKTNVPSQTPPQAPKLVQSAVMCPEGSSQIN